MPLTPQQPSVADLNAIWIYLDAMVAVPWHKDMESATYAEQCTQAGHHALRAAGLAHVIPDPVDMQLRQDLFLVELGRTSWDED